MLSTLRLVSRGETVRPMAACFLAGADAGRWLEDLAALGLAVAGTSLYLVPHSIDNPSPAGLLVIPPKGYTWPSRSRGMACGRLGERLLLPVDAELNPPLSEQELSELCKMPLLFFHPSLGLSGFETESGLRINDLLERPRLGADDWNCAQPGGSLPAALHRIEVEQAREDLFGPESQEIGSEAGDPLPATPDEPKEDAWSKAKRNLGHKGTKFLADLMGRLPHGGTRRNWLNRVEDWAHQKAAQFGADLERLRNKELHRLLHLLDHDPEKGLRHALPLNAFPHRGRAPSGASLGPHDLDFNLAHLGGGPADFWAVTPDLHEELTRRYRKLADRELHLKRFRRAAYIYAELLGDLPSAANALKQGRHLREAAILYEERLNNPLAAAQCLAEGGLLREAIERYEKLGRLLEMADLYEKLEDRASAQKTLRRLVQQHLSGGDALMAAQLLEKRLQEPEEALQVLEEAWPTSRQAMPSLAARFDLLARLGRHEAAAQGLARVRREPLAVHCLEPLAKILTGLAGTYPDQRVRHAAGDLVQVLASKRLSDPQIKTAEAQRLVGFLCRLAPQDRLLVRDGNRHLARHRQRPAVFSATTIVAPSGPKRPLEPKVLHRFELPQVDWSQFKADGLGFFAVGTKGSRLILLRGGWNGSFQSIHWPCSEYAAKNGLTFDLIHEEDRRIRLVISVLGQPGFEEQTLPPEIFFPRPCVAGTPGWLSPEMHPFAVAGSQVWALHLATGRAVLSCYDQQGSLVRTDDVTQGLLADAQRSEATRLCLVNVEGLRVMGLGNRLFIQGGAEEERIELPGQVTRLVPTLPYTRRGVVMLFETGAAVHWLATGQVIELDRDTRWVAATWIPSGKLVLLGAQEGRLYEVDSRGVTAVSSFRWHGRRPIAVTTAGEPSYFAVFTVQGEVSLFHAGESQT